MAYKLGCWFLLQGTVICNSVGGQYDVVAVSIGGCETQTPWRALTPGVLSAKTFKTVSLTSEDIQTNILSQPSCDTRCTAWLGWNLQKWKLVRLRLDTTCLLLKFTSD